MTLSARVRADFHQLAVAGVDRLCADAVAVRFAVPAGLADAYAFRAGQSLTLRRRWASGEQRRTYSICAPEGAEPRIGVREIPGGLFSSWLVNEVAPGELIEVGTPTGTFTPEAATRARHVLVAAGSGITPILSIAATVLREPANTVTLIYGNRRSDTVMFVDELADLKDRYPTRLELMHVLSREPREAELFSGRLDAARLRNVLGVLPEPATVDHWWLCGPYGLVEDARRLLTELGVPAERVHRELFYVDDLPPEPVRHAEPAVDGAATEVTVLLDGRSSTVRLPADQPVLDGAQRFRPDLPFACKGGVCGTCRAKVTNGAVRMRRNFALEEPEVAEGFVLTCQSLPDSDALTLDYDA
ncbi:ring-1,2-phenylacetyl-CoA epoxidase subunit PaaE [Tamaricihabitans halophyticus]|uniref:Ring-1,2-phenylacetyl-CoA epoxidase subunit PaaE n=1 Tax=Tamaricihabitans halophyticus TaxID=1262583 RepID=A0A4R2QSQ0_9PSEU|nr:1,2-phenylacetyl-CoA epoxidase subunit PaaE [Tamaricihabitans halophyticus]TCP50025.1 ring-1,2-phenylacetyl-CoA epoxidase subunit PaaE [Tamaricihabitans halophyticus]